LTLYDSIFLSVAWAYSYVELDLSPIVINAGVGGGAFMVFGLPANDITTANVILPDMHIAYKFGDTFRLGIGAVGIAGEIFPDNALPVLFYLTGRFSILFDK